MSIVDSIALIHWVWVFISKNLCLLKSCLFFFQFAFVYMKNRNFERHDLHFQMFRCIYIRRPHVTKFGLGSLHNVNGLSVGDTCTDFYDP